MKREFREIKVAPINSLIYNELYDKYGEALSCPCSKITIAYEDFVTNIITYHPVCTSTFITVQ